MRIAHVTATFPPYYGGTGTVCYHNALGLARAGHDVTVITANHPPGDHAYPEEITVRRLPVLFRIGNAPLLPGLLALEGFDIIHLHYPFYFGAETVFLKSVGTGQRYVVTYHQDVLFGGLLGVLERLHHRWLGTRVLLRAQKILATSWDYARESRLSKLLQSRPEQVSQLPNGVDAQRFRPDVDGSALRARYDLGPSDSIILFVGALDRAHYFKGVGILLEAMTLLPDASIRLLVVGGGDLRRAYQGQAQDLGLQDRVIFCGRVSDEELPYHYALCDLHVLPSITMGEAFGVVLLEAMATGKPVIASNLPGVRSVVSGGNDGLLTHPGDANDLAQKIHWLLDHPLRAREMGQQGRAKVEERYAWPEIIPQLEQIYKDVLPF